MGCSNCFSGCREITSDKCIKYTGIDKSTLDIANGDSLSSVVNSITANLQLALNGTGINLGITSNIICATISQYIPTNIPTNLVILTEAIVNAVCDQETELSTLTSFNSALEAPYYVGCLTNVIANSGTHDILQDLINYSCSLGTEITATNLDLETNYVAISDINSYIATYLAGLSILNPLTSVAAKMIPYTAMEYYGPLTYFDVTGAGIGNWTNVYLCNGLNGTPDKRGRVGVGTISDMGGGPLDAAVDPATSTNPNYTCPTITTATKTGANVVTLSIQNLPAHNHTNTAISTVTQTAHRHLFSDNNTAPTDAIRSDNGITPASLGTGTISAVGSTGIGSIYYTSASNATIAVATTLTNALTGGNSGHSNVQPVLACNYIIYIP